MKVFLLSLALGAPLATPVADVVPTWNVESSCRGAISADKSENFADIQTVNSCMNDENGARTELGKNWTTYSAAVRTRCEGEANQGGIASYVDLLVCLQISNDPGNQPAATPASTTSMKGAGKHRRKTQPK